jgi:hypothetical protein
VTLVLLSSRVSRSYDPRERFHIIICKKMVAALTSAPCTDSFGHENRDGSPILSVPVRWIDTGFNKDILSGNLHLSLCSSA